jgi:Protein of unknown function (DUF2849)
MAADQTQSLTANRLRDGEVVYWRGGAWIEDFTQADMFADKPSADAALAAAQAFVKDRVVVNPYLFAVRSEDGRPRAVETREIVRSEGPSVRRDLGKQAEPSMDSFDVSL